MPGPRDNHWAVHGLRRQVERVGNQQAVRGVSREPRYEAYSAALAARKQATVATHECEVEFLTHLWQHPIFRAALERAWEGFGVGVLSERPARAAGHVAVRVGPVPSVGGPRGLTAQEVHSGAAEALRKREEDA